MSSSKFKMENDLPPLVPEKRYEVTMKAYRTALMFAGVAPKLVMDFVILTPGDHYGVVLPKYYNVSHIKGRPAENGEFKVGRKSDFARDFFSLFTVNHRKPDGFRMDLFEGATLLAKVETVVWARNRSIPTNLQYSKVARLIKVLEHR